jgi:hypothetical protein
LTKPDIIERPKIDFRNRLQVTLETRTLVRNGVPVPAERKQVSFPAGEASTQTFNRVRFSSED